MNCSKVASRLAGLKETIGDAWDVVKLEVEELWAGIAPSLDHAAFPKHSVEAGANASSSTVAIHSIPVVVPVVEQPKSA